MENQPKKSWFKRHPFLIGIGILIVIIFIASAGDSTPRKVGENTSTTSSAKGVDDKVYQVGDKVQLGKSIVSVNSVVFSQGGQYNKPQAGNEWANLNITIENTDSSQQYVTTLGQMFIKDGQGNSYQVAVTDKVFENPNSGLDGTIIANSKRTGWVGFEIPKGATGLQFQYNGSMWGGGTVVINLAK
jgi:hypothetical protein